MSAGYTYGPKATKQIAATVHAVGMQVKNDPQMRGTGKRPGFKTAVILDEALPATTNALIPTSAMATRLFWDGTQYEELDDQIEVFNHSESTSYGVNTFGFTEEIDGHDCFGGDCSPMSSR